MINSLAKLFMGTNIGHRFPFLIKWYFQVQKVLSKGKDDLAKVTIPLDQPLLVSVTSLLGLELLLKGTFERNETQTFIRHVKPGDTLVDIGANIGYYTILASKLIGATGHVYAIEPDKYNISILKKNIENAANTNVEIIQCAVGDSEKHVTISSESDHAQTQIILTDGEVYMKTLDEIAKSEGIQQIDFLKVDTEGAELLVLNGAKALLKEKKIKKIFIEINAKKLTQFGTSAQVVYRLIAQNFALYFCENTEILASETELLKLLKNRDYVNLFGTALE